jgi:hypothetical protein
MALLNLLQRLVIGFLLLLFLCQLVIYVNLVGLGLRHPHWCGWGLLGGIG